MRFQILLIIIIFTLFTFVDSYPQQTAKDSLTLEDAVRLTLVNQPLIQKALEQVNAADARIKQQDSHYYPQVDAYLNYAIIGPIPSIGFGGMNFDLAPKNNYDAHISASHLVYDFGQRDAQLDLAKSYKLSSEDKLIMIKNNLTYQTVQIFYTILFLKRSVDVKDEEINTLQKHLDITTKKFQSGSATDFDILTTKVRIADAENQKIDIKNTLKQAEINLRVTLNLPSDTPLNLSGAFKMDSTVINSSSLLDEAFNNRPEMKLAKDSENSSVVSKKVASLTDSPTLSVLGEYGLKNGFEPNLDVLRGNWGLGINAAIPIFNGNLRASKVEEADANLKSSSANILALERDIKVEVEQAAADLESNKLKISTTQVQVDQAMQAVSRAEIQYRDGVITNLDLIDASTSLTQAKLRFLQAQFRTVLSYYNLKKVVGIQLY
jgi:outer membrane protein